MIKCPYCKRLLGVIKGTEIYKAEQKEKETWRPWQTDSIPEKWATDSTGYIDYRKYRIYYT